MKRGEKLGDMVYYDMMARTVVEWHYAVNKGDGFIRSETSPLGATATEKYPEKRTAVRSIGEAKELMIKDWMLSGEDEISAKAITASILKLFDEDKVARIVAAVKQEKDFCLCEECVDNYAIQIMREEPMSVIEIAVVLNTLAPVPYNEAIKLSKDGADLKAWAGDDELRKCAAMEAKRTAPEELYSSLDNFRGSVVPGSRQIASMTETNEYEDEGNGCIEIIYMDGTDETIKWKK